MNQRPTHREMDRAFRRRDAEYDGIFYVAVRSTGIFCRPSCPARKPKPQNVEFFDSFHQALLAGFRACKRCRPMDANGRPPEWVERLFARIERDPTAPLRDAQLRQLDIDPTRARRFFKTHYGITFQAYHRARRMGMAIAQLRGGGDLDDVALNTGYESNSGFRDAFVKAFGQPPGKGRNLNVAVAQRLETPLGAMIAVANEEGLCLLEFADRRAIETQLDTLRKRIAPSIVPGTNKHLKKLATELRSYFAHTRRTFTVPVVTAGTPFQRDVWNRLCRIPYGETISYEVLARDVKRPGAVRAVGTANGANRIAILIPCHRVIRKDGSMGGYGGGLWRKQFLLQHEERAVGAGDVPGMVRTKARSA